MLIGVLDTNEVVGATLLLDGWTSVVGGAGDDEDSGGATLLDEGATYELLEVGATEVVG